MLAEKAWVLFVISQMKPSKNLVDATIKKFNRLDVLINNAGIGSMRPVYGTSLESFEKVLK